MDTNFRAIIQMPTLKTVLGVENLNLLNQKQKKAYKNIKFCADDQWQYVNGWYDERDENCRKLMMNPRKLFDLIYSESQHSVFDNGYSGGGSGAESWLKDTRFCGKKFLQTVTLYYTAKLLEEAFPEVDGTKEDAARIAKELLALKSELQV